MSADEKKLDPPIAPPIAAPAHLSTPSSSGPVGPLRESTQRSPMPSESRELARPNNRAGTIGLRRLQGLVSERDVAVIQSVADHRLITSQQLIELHFWNHASAVSGIRAANRVLNRLRDLRLLRRLDRPVGGLGGGSTGFVWALDVAGDRLLRDGDPSAPRRRPFEPSVMFLAHTLAIAHRRVEIEQAARRGAYELLSVKTEPSNWRSFPGRHAQQLWLKPDLDVTTAIGEWEHDWFIEVDLGTESGTALLKKCRIYLNYFRSGREQRARGAFPRVVWLMPGQSRVTLLERLLGPEKAPVGLFTITTQERLVELLSDPDAFQTSAGEPPPSKTPQGDG